MENNIYEKVDVLATVDKFCTQAIEYLNLLEFKRHGYDEVMGVLANNAAQYGVVIPKEKDAKWLATELEKFRKALNNIPQDKAAVEKVREQLFSKVHKVYAPLFFNLCGNKKIGKAGKEVFQNLGLMFESIGFDFDNWQGTKRWDAVLNSLKSWNLVRATNMLQRLGMRITPKEYFTTRKLIDADKEY